MLMEVPDSMAETFQARINAEEKRLARVDDLNTNGAAAMQRFEAYLSKHYYTDHFPIVRASTYDSRYMRAHRFFSGYAEHDGVIDPPVIMRGAMDTIKMHRTAVYSWENDVVARWIRMMKITSIGRSPLWISLARKVNAKFPTRYVKMPYCGRRTVFIEGIQYYVQNEQLAAIKTLVKHLNKLDRIDNAVSRITNTQQPYRR